MGAGASSRRETDDAARTSPAALQWQDATKLFKEIDADGDGTISSVELALDLSTVTKFTGALLKKLTAALPVELEELDLQLAGSPAAKEEALVTALFKRLAGFANLRSIVFDGFMRKHASLVKEMKALRRINGYCEHNFHKPIEWQGLDPRDAAGLIQNWDTAVSC